MTTPILLPSSNQQLQNTGSMRNVTEKACMVSKLFGANYFLSSICSSKTVDIFSKKETLSNLFNKCGLQTAQWPVEVARNTPTESQIAKHV